MCAALAHLLIEKVEEGLLLIMENVPRNEKITSLLDYFVELLMERVTLLVAQLVEALRYKPEGRGFDSRWCHWNFSLT